MILKQLTPRKCFANLKGLAGSNEMEAAQCDMVVDCVEDALKPVLQIFFEKDDSKKVQRLIEPNRDLDNNLSTFQLQMYAKFDREQLPVYMTYFEKLLLSNKGEEGYFVGDKVVTAPAS